MLTDAKQRHQRTFRLSSFYCLLLGSRDLSIRDRDNNNHTPMYLISSEEHL
jgi:hypothetical protein